MEIFVITHLTTMKKNKNLAEVMHIELRQTNKTIKDYRNTRFNEYIDIIADIIVDGQRKGVFRKDILPNIAKRTIYGALDEVSRVWNISLETNYSLEEAGTQLIDMLLAGLLTSQVGSPLKMSKVG